MKSALIFAACGMLIQLSQARAAEACVSVRTDTGEACMKFAPSEQKAARLYGVRLGSPFSEARQVLARKGWHIDREWVRRQPATPRDGELICGSGYDAVCTTAFVRHGRHAFVSLSANNDGMPVIGIGDRE